jgi:ABC-type iron transport system FetAB permease component
VETKPTATPKSSTPAEPKTVYHVAVLFGIAAPGTPPENVQLKSYPNLKRLRALPSAKAPLVVFRGVTAGGTDATFTLVGEAILHGAATCIPSASQCQAIDLKPGQTEELESLPANGAPITYRLELVSITSSSASAAAARRAFHEESKPGRDLLRRIGLVALPGMHYSKVKGVLVFGGHPALAVRVHAVAPARHDKR